MKCHLVPFHWKVEICDCVTLHQPLFLRLLFFEQICPPPAQDGASLGPRLRCPLPVVWEWEWERRSHGVSCGVPSDGAVAPNSADSGRIPAKQSPAVGGEEANEGGDRKWPQEENTQGGHGQNAADLRSKYSRWNRWPKTTSKSLYVSNLKYEKNQEISEWYSLLFMYRHAGNYNFNKTNRPFYQGWFSSLLAHHFWLQWTSKERIGWVVFELDFSCRLDMENENTAFFWIMEQKSCIRRCLSWSSLPDIAHCNVSAETVYFAALIWNSNFLPLAIHKCYSNIYSHLVNSWILNIFKISLFSSV